MSAFLTLDINSIPFTITKAHIRESLQSPFHITCNGFIESFYADIFSATFASLGKTNSPSHTIQSHIQDTHFTSSAPPYSFALDQPFNLQALQDSFALLYISNPYTNTNYHNALSISLGNTSHTSTPIKSYKGIITHIEYLGSKSNVSLDKAVNALSEAKEYLGSKSNVSLDTNNTIDTLPHISNTSQQKTLNTLSSLDIPTPKSIKHRHFFTFTLTSPLIRLSLNKANRIYTDKTALDILKDILTAYAPQLCKQIDFSSLSQTDNPLEIITQYQESDLDFITRLAHNNGIYFYEDNDTLYVCHHTPYTPIPLTKVPFNPNVKTHNNLNEPCIFAFTQSHHIHTQQFNFFSNDANNPQIHTHMYSKHIDKQSFTTHSSSNDTSQEDINNHQSNPYYSTASTQSVFIPNVSFTHQANIKSLCSNQAQYATNTQALMKAQSNIYTLCLAQRLHIEYQSLLGNTIEDNKMQASINEYTIIALEQTLINESILADTLPSHQQDNDSNISQFKDAYSNILTLLPSNLSYMPTPKPKPHPPSLMQGIVVGEEYIKAKNIKEANASIIKQRNTIYTDEYGRVRVRLYAFMAQALLTDNDIHTTNNTNNNKHSNNTHLQDDLHTLNTHTPFLRVSSPIASASSGFYHTPRIGDEVLISYLNNDIDMPIIIGSLYNQSNPTLSSLPLASHQTSLSARTLNNEQSNTEQAENIIESGFNEITLSNLKDKEHIYIQAQKDYNELIKHNFTQTIQNNKESQVEGTYNERIKKIHTQSIDLAKIVSIGGEYNTNVALSKDTIVGGSHTLNIGASNKLRVAKDSNEYVGEDKEVEIGGVSTQRTKGHFSIIGESSGNIHTAHNLNLSSMGELSLASSNLLNISTKQSLGILANKSLVFSANKVLQSSQTTYEIQAKDNIQIQTNKNLEVFLGEHSKIFANNDTILLQVGENSIKIDKEGISIQGKLKVKK